MEPVVYISLELKGRDLDQRLLVTAELLKRGLNVVIGQQWLLSKNIFNLPKGVFLFKTVNEIQASNMYNAAQAGHIITASDEEVFACDCEDCFKSGMGPTAAAILDIFFAQGKKHADIVAKQYPEFHGNIAIAGNPRIDLLRDWGQKCYQSEATRIKKDVGPFILYNTNFGWINSIWNKKENPREIAIRTGHLVLDDPKSVQAYEAELDWEQKNLNELEKLAFWTSKNLKHIKTVIRPHPAEDSDYWKSKFKNINNVIVAENTNHIPWTMAASLLIHTTCSTGMEASLLNIPSLSITPKPEAAQHNYILSNRINCTTKSWQTARDIVDNFISRKNGPLTNSLEPKVILEEYFSNIDQNMAATIIASNIKDKLECHTRLPNEKYKWALKPNHPWIPIKRRDEWKKKFSITAEEFAQRMKKMGDLAKLNKKVIVKQIDDSLFLVS